MLPPPSKQQHSTSLHRMSIKTSLSTMPQKEDSPSSTTSSASMHIDASPLRDLVQSSKTAIPFPRTQRAFSLSSASHHEGPPRTAYGYAKSAVTTMLPGEPVIEGRRRANSLTPSLPMVRVFTGFVVVMCLKVELVPQQTTRTRRQALAG